MMKRSEKKGSAVGGLGGGSRGKKVGQDDETDMEGATEMEGGGEREAEVEIGDEVER